MGTKDDGSAGISEKHASAWIVDELDAGCLLGNSWLHPRDTSIEYDTSCPHFVLDKFAIPFAVLKMASLVVWKVTNR